MSMASIILTKMDPSDPISITYEWFYAHGAPV